jgi:uncharacterized protein (DUF1330 family)
MKPTYRTALAGAAGLIIGAGATGTLLAQTAAPQAYLVANISQVTDPAEYKTYGEKAANTHAAFGGRVLVRGEAQGLDSEGGNWANDVPPKGRIVIIAFPSMEKLKAWWHSPGYSAARPFRESATLGSAYVVEGLPPT